MARPDRTPSRTNRPAMEVAYADVNERTVPGYMEGAPSCTELGAFSVTVRDDGTIDVVCSVHGDGPADVGR